VRSRLKALERLAALYKVVEHAHGISLDRARGTLYELETEMRERAAVSARLIDSGSEALRRGDLHEWILDHSQIEYAEWNAAALEELRLRREEAMRSAAEAYQESRMQLEQMQSVLGEVRSRLVIQKERLEQRASDDRYLSRQRWQRRTAAQRENDTEPSESRRNEAPGDVDA